jgi:hypothetical protein
MDSDRDVRTESWIYPSSVDEHVTFSEIGANDETSPT